MSGFISPAKMYDNPDIPTHLSADDWTLYDKVTYGGLGYGAFTLPANMFIIIITCIFPPLGQIITILGTTISDTPPYFTLDALKLLINYDNIKVIMYSFILTTLFYIPGLVYVLGNVVDIQNK